MKYQRYILNRFTRFTTTLFIIVALFSLYPINAPAMAGWQTETIDSTGNGVGAFNSLAFDKDENPAISYSSFPPGNLRFARFNVPNPGWNITGVVSNGNHPGLNNSLAFDLSGNPAIAYSNFGNDDLKFARFNGASWDITTVDSAGARADTSLAFDLLSNPAISYTVGFSGGDLKFARFNGASWDITTVDSAGGKDPSLAFDPLGNPAISYALTLLDDPPFNNFNVKFARFNGTSWVITTITSTGDVNRSFTSLAFDASGNPAISFQAGTFFNPNLKFAHFNGVAWDITTVDSAGGVGGSSSLVFDALGNPSIAYHDSTNGDLKFARFNGASWDITTVDSAGDVSGETSLAFDSSSNPAISYRDSTNGGLKFARFVPPGVCDCPEDSLQGCISGSAVTNIASEPLAGKIVVLKRTLPRRPRVKMRVRTDGDGCYRFTDLEDGTYKIKIKNRSKNCKGRGGERKIVVIEGGGKVNDVNFECR